MSNHSKETEARCPHCYRHYVEGTAAWALYMMRMGHKVTNPMYDNQVYHLPEGGMIHINGRIETIAANLWVDYWCIDIPDGWQLYEPKPETAFKEGSKEWALYQIRSGKKVVKEGDGELYCSSFYKNLLFYLNDYGCLVAQNERGLIDPCSEVEFLNLDKAGWQIYKESKPEPEYKAGDWVKYGIDTYLQVIEASGDERTSCKTLSGITVYPYTSCLSKIDPSEVIVKIGCLSGPVRRSSSSHFCIICGDHWSMIAFAMLLDTPTREMVERLLKVQEEK